MVNNTYLYIAGKLYASKGVDMTLPKVGTQVDSGIVSQLIGQYHSTGDKSYLGQARRKAIELGLPNFVDMVSDVDEKPVSYAEKFETLQYAIRHERGHPFEPVTAVGELYRELFWNEDVDGAFYRILAPEFLARTAAYIMGTILNALSVDDAETKVSGLYIGIIDVIRADKNAPPAIKELAEKAATALDGE